MIEQAYVYLIVTGATIFGVLLTLWFHARKASRLNLALIRANEQCGFDLPLFLDRSWGLLAPSGLIGLHWRLGWFGTVTERRCGKLAGRRTERTIAVGEMTILLAFHQHEGGGERRYFEQGLIETFSLLVRTDMLIKAGTIDAALSHMSRLNLFLQHDMKNIAQFIQLMGDQLDAVPDGKERMVIEHLRRATPLIRDRADRIVRTLTLGSAPLSGRRSLSVRDCLLALCELYQLDHTIEGDVCIDTRTTTLDTVFDNLMKNYRDLALREKRETLRVCIAIESRDDDAVVTLQAPDAPEAVQVERLFEPFWSNEPNGLGIGLYQARHLIEAQGGSLTVDAESGRPPVFRIRFPLAAPA